jgi:superfamily II DNA or RNA helicase
MADYSFLNLPLNLADYLYDHQLGAVAELIGYKRARAVVSVAGGKTAIEASLIVHNHRNVNEAGIYVVLCPRIMLTSQLMIASQDVIAVKAGIRCQIGVVNSGRIREADAKLKELLSEFNRVHGVEFIRPVQTPNAESVAKLLEAGIKNKRPVCLYGTYQSAAAISAALNEVGREADIVIADESHYLVSNRYRSLIAQNQGTSDGVDKGTTSADLDATEELPTARLYCFTATEKYTDDEINGIGLNNINRFGPPAVNLPLIEMVRREIVCPPRFSTLDGAGTVIVGQENVGFAIKRGFSEVDAHFMSVCNQGAKLLVNTSGTKQMLWFLNSNECRELVEAGVRVAVTGSNKKVGNYLDGQRLSREEWFNEVQKIGKDPTAKLVLVHHAILTVGIDVPGLNALLVLYYGDKIGFLQSVGRILRTNGSKPYGLVTVPDFAELNDAEAIARHIVEDLLEEGFDSSVYVNIQEVEGEKEEPDALQRLKRIKAKSSTIQSLVLQLEELKILKAKRGSTLEDDVRQFLDSI